MPSTPVSIPWTDSTSKLSLAHIPTEHHVNVVFYAKEVDFVFRLAWLCGTYGAFLGFFVLVLCTEYRTPFRTAFQRDSSPLAMSFFKDREL